MGQYYDEHEMIITYGIKNDGSEEVEEVSWNTSEQKQKLIKAQQALIDMDVPLY